MRVFVIWDKVEVRGFHWRVNIIQYKEGGKYVVIWKAHKFKVKN